MLFIFYILFLLKIIDALCDLKLKVLGGLLVESILGKRVKNQFWENQICMPVCLFSSSSKICVIVLCIDSILFSLQLFFFYYYFFLFVGNLIFKRYSFSDSRGCSLIVTFAHPKQA